MNTDDLQAVGQIAGYVILGALVTWKAHKAEKKAEKGVVAGEKAAEHAEKAETYAKPTGNGFADRVTSALTRIEQAQKRDAEMLYDHIRAHANADILKGARGYESPQDPNAP